MSSTVGYAAQDSNSPLALFHFDRRELRPNDVEIDILYCGVCHSDLHQARNDWKNSSYPLVPGHEIVGRVAAVGSAVTAHAVGDPVAVGCLVDSCGECDQCAAGEEQLCRRGGTPTYNGKDRHTGDPTFGGYSKRVVVRDSFVVKVADSVDLSTVAPLLCAGITTYSPLMQWNVGADSRVAVAGLGGLGHMAVKLAVALGAEVTVLTTSTSKAADAHALGAHNVIVTTDSATRRAAASSFDIIIDTIPVPHALAPYLSLLDIDGALVLVGVIDELPPIHSAQLLQGRKRITASGIGGIRETQELLDLCAERGITPECEIIPIQDINAAYVRMERGDVRYRFVIDMASL